MTAIPTPGEMEAGRFLIRHGRILCAMNADDIERGALAVCRDPYYREEIWRAAVRHCESCCTCPPPSEAHAALRKLGGLPKLRYPS